MKVLVTQSCPTLCDCMDCSPPDSSVHGILQARILEWVAISFWGSSWPRDWTWVSCIAIYTHYSLVAQMVKCLPTMQENWVLSLDQEDPLAWKIPWTEERDWLQSMGSQRGRHDWVTSLSLSYLYLYLYVTHFALLQKLTQNCKPTILQWTFFLGGGTVQDSPWVPLHSGSLGFYNFK